MDQKRRSLRIPVQVWVKNLTKNEMRVWLDDETLGGDFTFCYTTQDLSEGGLFLETDAPLTVGEVLDIELALPGEEGSFEVRGRVRWVRDTESAVEHSNKPGMGVEFLDPAPELAAAIQRFLTARA